MEIFKLVAALLCVGMLIYRRINLGFAMGAGAICLGFLYSVPSDVWTEVVRRTLFSSANLRLIGALYLIMALENILRNRGMLDQMLAASKALVPDSRIVMAMLPAFIGLLPSLGGALFSAPLVNQVAAGLNLSAERKLLINYWFRHVWEYFLPVFPAILLTSTILAIPARDIILHFTWLSLLNIAIGFLFCFDGIDASYRSSQMLDKPRREYVRDLLVALCPILVILALVIAARWEVVWATALVLAALFAWYKYTPQAIVRVLNESFHRKLIIQVLGVLFFKEMLMLAGAVDVVVLAIKPLGVPPVALIGILSAMLGLLTGFPQAVIGTVFPLILAFPDQKLQLAMVGLVLGVGGQMASPMHLCMVVTQDYFKASFTKILPRIVLMQSSMAVAALVAYHLW